MKHIHFVLTFVASILSTVVYSAQITEEQALEKATQFWNTKNGTSLRSTTDLSLVYTCKDSLSLLRSASGTTGAETDTTIYYYVFNVGESDGFVIISGNDVTKTVLGYSDESVFQTADMPDNLKFWLNYYRSAIKDAISNGTSTALLDSSETDTTTNNGLAVRWIDTEDTASKTATTVSLRSTNVVKPLLGSIKWDQGSPYYNLCPYDSEEDAYTYTGCIATAMAQIMKYYEWPVTGTGSNRYMLDGYGFQYANFGTTTYDWDNMLDSYGGNTSDTEENAVATLMYHCGVAVDMDYSVDGSGSNSYSAATALVDHFGYDEDIQYVNREYYSSSQWAALVMDELNAARPVLYSGTSGDYGHAYVCDGYDSDGLFHINWGYSGMYNGYYELSVLNYESDKTYTTGGYTTDQIILTGIQKPDNVSKPFYQMVLYSNGLTSGTSRLSSASSGFTLSYGFVNYGLNTFNGHIGVALYKEGTLQDILASDSALVNSFYGTEDYSLTDVTLPSLSSGAYQLYAVYKPTGTSAWSVFKPNNQLNNYLNVTVDGSSVTISKPAEAPVLTLADTLRLLGNAYKGKTANFSVSIQNTGSEFYSNLAVYLYKTTSTSITQYVNYGVVCIPSGETRTFTISGTLSCSAGTYYAVAVFDSTNNLSTGNYKKLTPSSMNPVSVIVLSTPSTASITLDSPVAFSDSSTTICKNQEVALNATITNSGGYYDYYLIAFIFPEAGGYSVGYLDPKTICIDMNETQTVSLTGTIDLAPADYFLALYYYPSDSWTVITPQANSILSFTVTNQTVGLSEATSSGLWNLYPNPASDVLTLQSPETVRYIRIRDLSGRIVLETRETKPIPVSDLVEGIYLLQAETEGGTIQTLRFIKK